MPGAADIILGEGVFSIGTTDVALTRGGGKFTVERDYRRIDADGDKGPVKGRMRLTKSEPKLTMKALELLPANIPLMYPAVAVDTGTADHSKFTGKALEDADYQATVKWTGKTLGGKAVVITLSNAINLENIDWELADKNEIVPELTYVGCYTDGSDVEPWEIDIATA